MNREDAGVRIGVFTVALCLHALILAALVSRTVSEPIVKAPSPFGAEDGGADGFSTVAFLFDAAVDQERQQPSGALVPPILTRTLTFDDLRVPEVDSVEEVTQLDPERAQRGDPTRAQELERLRGIYFSQVHARVARAWERPAGRDQGLDWVQCIALVRQDVVGQVIEVELAGCPIDARLEQSIVNAVYRASPLPAPPDPQVFTPQIRIAFDLRSDKKPNE
jgi:hypothetical protein